MRSINIPEIRSMIVPPSIISSCFCGNLYIIITQFLPFVNKPYHSNEVNDQYQQSKKIGPLLTKYYQPQIALLTAVSAT